MTAFETGLSQPRSQTLSPFGLPCTEDAREANGREPGYEVQLSSEETLSLGNKIPGGKTQFNFYS